MSTNPLRDPQDRRLPKVAGPCGMVIFGVTGDLARKKLMPAIYDLANRGLLPPGFSLVGFARRDWADEDFAQVVHDAVKQHSRTGFREEVWRQLAEGFRFVPGQLRRRPGLRHPAQDHRRARRPPRHQRQPRLLPLHPARGSSVTSSASSRSTVSPTAPRTPGGAWSSRSRSARTSRRRARAQRGPQRGVPARVGLPHRPLPRQGDGPEHPRDALRQHAVRADLELQLRRPRADHHGRGHRPRGSGRLLRRHRRRARRHPEPPHPAHGAHGHGGAHVLRVAQPARREVQGARVGGAPPPPRPDHRARTVRRGLGRWREGARLPRRAGHPEDLDDRDVRRDQARHRQPPLVRRAVLPAHRQAARPTRHRGGRVLQAGTAPAVPRARPPRTSATTRW